MATIQDTATAMQVDLRVGSAALRRLTEEVAAGATTAIRGYNRTHNRHNR